MAARLFGEALGPDRLNLLHVDNGLMRKDESAGVVEMFSELGLDKNFHFIDATDTFLEALEGMIEPEAKRRAIGDTFITVFESEAKRLGIEDHLLGPGHHLPRHHRDRRHQARRHHQDPPQPGADHRGDDRRRQGDRTAGRPVQGRGARTGRDAGHPPRHDLAAPLPRPRPGRAAAVFRRQGGRRRHTGDDRPGGGQALAPIGLTGAPLPIKSVGVKADLRSYEHPVLIHGEADWDTLAEASGTIFKTVDGINRTLWNLTDTLPTSFRPLAATMTRDRLDLLRECDHLMMDGLRRHGLYGEVWQCPTVLVPLEIDGQGRELCILRPIHSERAMTATAARLPRGAAGRVAGIDHRPAAGSAGWPTT